MSRHQPTICQRCLEELDTTFVDLLRQLIHRPVTITDHSEDGSRDGSPPSSPLSLVRSDSPISGLSVGTVVNSTNRCMIAILSLHDEVVGPPT
ncbi:hypothetical protein SERLA73DRAFT_74760 [Serpula lacrymans var. lacrymans S7.3]|uniref:Uncharacterized protein n=1 Tax=Serpula lacrymans var. lacrymans (strain S7.3) TaxID=936435 RepID=F8Q0B7_SERL3|nr:hypothetical protein SERLA73DRAFT_74760 [Serpula lacrymans var. lacrymans S7.3]